MVVCVKDVDFPQEFYKKNLETIGGLKFTNREVDIMAFTLSRKSSKIIAAELLISPRTVENHISNIMTKLDCNSREAVIDFAEKSGKLLVLKDYYVKVLINREFEKCLKSFSLYKQVQHSIVEIVYWQQNNGSEDSLACHLANHLNMAGIQTAIKAQKNQIFSLETLEPPIKDNYVIYLLPPEFSPDRLPCFLSLQEGEFPENVFLLFSEDSSNMDSSKESCPFNIIELNKQKDFYSLVFEILKKVSTDSPALERAIVAFEQKGKEKAASTHFSPSQPYKTQEVISPLPVLKSVSSLKARAFPVLYLLLSCFLIGLFTLILMIFFEREPKNKTLVLATPTNIVRSEFILPKEASFLNRSDLLIQITSEFKKHAAEIQTIALVSVGGAGKTTIARQYARLQKNPVAWELNAETKESLMSSLEALAYALAGTEEEKKNIKKLEDIKNPEEKEEKLIESVKKFLRARKNWLLLYDNVENFSNIEKYFPCDSSWGKGKVIITTRDSNIQNNNHVNSIIEIGELSVKDRLNIFTKVMDDGGKTPLTPAQKEQARKFLEAIPPFPLDISSAAYYLKATNISYEKYLDHLREHNKDFEALQKNVLKETSGYTKTRYSILQLSLMHISDIHKDFSSLLLFISLLDSQNISRDLLEFYKGVVTVDNLIYYLKKYFLISSESFTSFDTAESFSMHRSTQEIILAYFMNTLEHDKNDEILQSIGMAIKNYIEEVIAKEDFPKMKTLVPHVEAFLSRAKLLPDEICGSIEGGLGQIYFYLGYYFKAKETLQNSLKTLNKKKLNKALDQNFSDTARILSYLGIVSRELGDFEESKTMLKQSLQIYTQHVNEDHVGIARVLGYLGTIARELGNFEEAKGFLEQSLIVYKEHLPENYVGIARALGYAGIVSRELGNYNEAKNFLEQSLSVYEKRLPENHIGTAWSLIHLGKVYEKLGEYTTAKTFIEKGLDIYKKHFPEDNTAWALVYLGSVYTELGDFEKAKSLLEQSLTIYQQTLPHDHVYKGWVLALLGSVYRKTGDYETAKVYFEESFAIHENKYGKDHIEIARILSEMGKNSLSLGQQEAAESQINNALIIFEKRKHPEKYIALEALADLYLKKSSDAALNKATAHMAKNFKLQAVSYLKKAYDIVKSNFSKDFSRALKIESKLKAAN